MADDQERQAEQADDSLEPERPAARNPFSDRSTVPDDPALISTRKSAAISGVIVGLIALLFVVVICVAASFAFG